MSVTITRGFPYSRINSLWNWLNTPRNPNFDDYGPTDVDQFYPEVTYRMSREMVWNVESNEELCGFIGFAQSSPVAGIMRGVVIAPDYRGKGVAKAALRLMIAEMQQKGVVKIQAMVYADNLHVQGLMASLGGVKEGYCRNITKRNGVFLDGSLWSLAGHDV